MHSYILETARLTLRPLTQADAEAAFVWLSDPAVNRFMPYNLYQSVEEARAWLKTVEEDDGPEITFGIVRREDGLLIGSCGVGPNEEEPQRWEIGYNLRADCWNHGYATEASRAMIRFAHDTFGAVEFGANHAVENPASGKVMEHCGMHFSHFGEYSTFDKSETFPARFWRMDWEDFRA